MSEDGVGDPVLIEIAEGVATLTLNRPGSGNALNTELAIAFADAVHAVVGDPEVAAIVLRARGRNFCVGGDLAAIGGADDRGAMVGEVLDRLNVAIALLHRAERPVVAVVQGAVAGGGLGIALVADVIIAEPAARFLFAYPLVGLPPDCGVSWLLPRAVGMRSAIAMALTDRELRAGEALAVGLVAEIAAEGDGAARALELTARIAASGAAYSAARRLMMNAASGNLSDALAAEYAAMFSIIQTDAAGRRIEDFLNRGRSS